MPASFAHEPGAPAIAGRASVERLVIHQPNLFPRLKVLQKIVRGDAWVVLDDVQYMAREWQNRARLRYLKRPEREFWLTIPVHTPHGRASAINTVEALDPAQTGAHIRRALHYCYHHSKYWDWIDAYISETLRNETRSLADLCVRSAQACLSMLGIARPLHFSSHMHIHTRKTRRLLDICEVLQARTYVSGSGGRSYLDQPAFAAANIAIEWQRWERPGNIPERIAQLAWRNVSFLDLAARCGPDALKEHLLCWNEGES